MALAERIETAGKVVTMIVVPLITAATGYFVYRQNDEIRVQNERIAALDARLKERAAEREDFESRHAFNFKIYEAVKDSLGRDAHHQEAARVLVVSIASEPLRTALLDALAGFRGLDGAVKERVKEDLFRAQQQAVLVPSQRALDSARGGFKWEDWDYDLFWCEASGDAARLQAEAVLAAMKREGAAGRLRVRPLADVINARDGYKVSGYAIRRDPGEETQAEALRALAERTLGRPEIRFATQPSGQATRWYLSAFFCPPAR